jgi:hypothetical protein
MKKTILYFLFIISTIVTLCSCYYDKAELLYPNTVNIDCNTITATFSNNVLPIITGKCATIGCHDATAAGGAIFVNYTQIKDKIDRINTRTIVEKSMPTSGPLSTAEIAVLKCWIDSGSPNN